MMALPAKIELRLPRKSFVRLTAVSAVSLILGLWLLSTAYSEYSIVPAVFGCLFSLGGMALVIATIRCKVTVTQEFVQFVRLGTNRIEYDSIEKVAVPDFGTMILYSRDTQIKVRDKWPASVNGLRLIARSLAGRDLLFDGDRRGIREYFGAKADLALDAATFEREKESILRILQLMADDAPSKEIFKNWPNTHLRSGFLRTWWESISEDWIHMPKIKVVNGQADKSSQHYGYWQENQFEIRLALEVLRCNARETQLEQICEMVRQMDDLSIDVIPLKVRVAHDEVVDRANTDQL